MKLLPLNPCEQCWETYEPKNPNQKYCSRECGRKHNNEKKGTD